MKVVTIALFASSLATPTDALGFRDLVKRVSRKQSRPESFADAVEAVAVATEEEQGERQLQLYCDYSSEPFEWHPQYGRGWAAGYCDFTRDCNSPGFSTELACCKGAYAGQVSGFCLSRLPNPPTTSPTGAGGLDVYYPDYSTAWPDAGCINTRPMPSGRPTYSTMLACCKGAYGGQVSGKCLSQLPNPPTTSPTTSGGKAGFWYPDYDTAWTEAGCLNTLPLPYPNVNDRPNYSTNLACCKAAYGGQVSGKCLSQLPNPPTTSPTSSGGLDVYYPDYDTSWAVAGCINTRPMPSGRPTYSTMLACCKGAYAGQTSGKCLSELPNPPTTSPTSSGGLDGTYYPDYSLAWSEGKCINDAPLPSGRPTYSSKSACCSGAYGNQVTHECMCDVDPCYSCKCDLAETPACASSLTCS